MSLKLAADERGEWSFKNDVLTDTHIYGFEMKGKNLFHLKIQLDCPHKEFKVYNT